MAHDRTERFKKLLSQTSADVGPGTYDITDCCQIRNHFADLYPFLSGAKRQTLTVSKDVIHLPAPNLYCVKEPRRHIPERVSIDFTSTRFKELGKTGPGPVDYDVKHVDCFKRKPHPGTWKGPAGKLWLTAPPRSILPQPISIPDKHHTGYYVDEHGVFKKNPPYKHEPIYLYSVPREEINMTTRMYKGNFWSRMTGRTAPRRSLAPGPADYDLETKKTPAQLYDEKIREFKKKTSRLLRTHDIMHRRIIRENLPGPNNYRVKGWFDKFLKISCKCDLYGLEPPPFGHTAKRFSDEQSDTPAPGTYDPQTEVKCVASILLAPFGSYVSRSEKEVKEPRPGPADHHSNIGNLAYESQRRFKYSHLKPRPHIILSQSSPEDEVTYYIPDFVQKHAVKKCAVYHAAFKSRTERLSLANKAKVPDPGAYEVLTAFKATRDRCEFLRRPVAFGSGRDRFPKKISEDKNRVPGPTCYELSGDISKNVKGGVMSVGDSVVNKFHHPGPTYYCLHPYFTSSVVKKSFNVKLGKPQIIADALEKEKPIARPRCPCIKKKLRWFMAPEEKLKLYQKLCH